MGKSIIYFDNAATTFPKPEEVYNFMDEFYRDSGVNAGRGMYTLARKSSELINETKHLIAELVNEKQTDRIIFTPSATIALNQILNGLCWDAIQNVYITPFEHNAIVRTLYYIQKQHKFNIHIIPFDNFTFNLEQEKLRINFSKNNPDLILMSHVSNVTGYILPIEEIMIESKKYNPINIIDCAQSIGLIQIDIEKIDADFIVFAGHKTLYGPFGIAGYIDNYKKGQLKPFIVGGTGSDSTNLEMPTQSPYLYEAGSYNIQAIAGLNAALKWLKNVGQGNIFNRKKELVSLLMSEIKKLKGIETYVPKDISKHIGILSLNIDGYTPNDIGHILDEEFNISVRTGHHCAPLMGEFLGGQAITGTVRISTGYFNTEEQILKLSRAIYDLY